MTVEKIKKNDVSSSEDAANVRKFLDQPCFIYSFNVKLVGVVKEADELVMFLDNLKDDTDISKRGTFVECRFAGPDASYPYKITAGLDLA